MLAYYGFKGSTLWALGKRGIIKNTQEFSTYASELQIDHYDGAASAHLIVCVGSAWYCSNSFIGRITPTARSNYCESLPSEPSIS